MNKPQLSVSHFSSTRPRSQKYSAGSHDFELIMNSINSTFRLRPRLYWERFLNDDMYSRFNYFMINRYKMGCARLSVNSLRNIGFVMKVISLSITWTKIVDSINISSSSNWFQLEWYVSVSMLINPLLSIHVHVVCVAKQQTNKDSTHNKNLSAARDLFVHQKQLITSTNSRILILSSQSISYIRSANIAEK